MPLPGVAAPAGQMTAGRVPLPGVARSGPVRGHLRFRDRGVLRGGVLMQRPAIITP
ncbi:hypothetical protein K1Y80_31895 [Streptomyces sp. MAG02]|nr:hypothetical protein [Streptomyces sp. MAG02]